LESATGFAAWTPAERESFFAAIARHRRAAWRVTLASTLADAVLALVVALLMSPLFYAAIALAFDLVNLVHRVPNVVTLIGRVLGPALEPAGRVPLGTWVHLGLLAALPGVLWMGLVLLMLDRALRRSAAFTAGELPARAPNPQVLAEQRFKNVIDEMAIAANLPAPRVLVADSGGVNAAAFGRDEHHASIMVSQGLLTRLNREQLQGVAAHLIGSIADGDMAIGLRAATTLSLFAFLARFAGVLGERSSGRSLLRLALAMLRPTAASAERLSQELADPFRNTDEDGKPLPRGESTKLQSWRDWVWLPLMGPLVITGFLAGLVNLFLLAPLVALAWRQRKYMADATAVRLTRDPDGLASALQELERSDGGAAFAAWAAHFAVVSPGSRARGLLGSSFVPMHPAVTRRLRALERLGAHVSYDAHRLPVQLLLILVPLGALIGGLLAIAACLLAYVSVPLSMLFLGIPFAVIHVLLRWIAGG
jgi:Zn-dependent protease with chaperone function